MAETRPVTSILAHGATATAVAFSKDSKYFASASKDKTVKLFDAQKWDELRTLRGHQSAVNCLVCLALAGGGDWEGGGVVSDGSMETMGDGPGNSESSSVENGRCQERALSAEVPKGMTSCVKIAVVAAASFHMFRQLAGHPHQCLRLTPPPQAFHPTRPAQLATGSRDKTIKLWDATGQGIRTYRGHGGPVLSLCFSPSGDRMVSGGDDGIVIEWDVETGDVLRRLEEHAGGVLGVSMSPPGRRFVASASDDFTMKLWNLATGTVLRTVQHKDAVHTVAFSTVDNHIVASGCRDGCIYLWHVDSGELMFALEGHTDVVNHVCFSPDGWRLVSASADTTLKLWSLDTCQLLRTFKGHTSNVSGVACSGDNQWIASSGWDCTVKIWPHGAEDDKGANFRLLQFSSSDILSDYQLVLCRKEARAATVCSGRCF